MCDVCVICVRLQAENAYLFLFGLVVVMVFIFMNHVPNTHITINILKGPYPLIALSQYLCIFVSPLQGLPGPGLPSLSDSLTGQRDQCGLGLGLGSLTL